MPERRIAALMVDDREDPKTFYSKEMAGKGSLDDEMLPNRGEPVPQAPDPQSAETGEGIRAGFPPLDDEMLPNRGEPVPQGNLGGMASGLSGGGPLPSRRDADEVRAGVPPLDDEMLPNRGEPVPQNAAAHSEVRDPLMKGDAGFRELRAELDAEREPQPQQKALDPYSLGPGDTGGGRIDLEGTRNRDQGDVGRDHLWKSGEVIRGRHHGRGDEE